MQLQVRDLKARVIRLERLAKRMAKEIALWRGAKDVLLSRERRQYLNAIQEALAGADEARVVLAGAAKRLEGG